MPKLIVDENWMIKTLDKVLNDQLDINIAVDRFEANVVMGKKEFSIKYTEASPEKKG